MVRRIDPRFFNNFVDTHFFDRTGGPEDNAVDQILALADAGEITLSLPHSVQSEIEHPQTPDYVKQQASRLLFSIQVQLTPDEENLHRRIRSILRGNAKPGKHDKDAYHIVEGNKNGGGYFITQDIRIHKKASEFANLLQIVIVTPTQFLKYYHRC